MSMNLSIVLWVVLLATVAIVIERLYKSIIVNTAKESFHKKVRPMVIAMTVLALLGIFLRFAHKEFHFLGSYEMWPLNMYLVLTAVNAVLLVSTVFNRECRYRITELVKHPRTAVIFGFLLMLLKGLLSLLRILWKVITYKTPFDTGYTSKKRKFKNAPFSTPGTLTTEQDARRRMGKWFQSFSPDKPPDKLPVASEVVFPAFSPAHASIDIKKTGKLVYNAKITKSLMTVTNIVSVLNNDAPLESKMI